MTKQVQSTKRDNNHEHELSLDGVRGFVADVEDGGERITVCGWDRGHYRYEKGDRVLLKRVREDDSETRYKVLELRACGDPPDMYFLDLEFAPRSGPGKLVKV